MRKSLKNQSIKVCGKPHKVSSINCFTGIVWYKRRKENRHLNIFTFSWKLIIIDNLFFSGSMMKRTPWKFSCVRYLFRLRTLVLLWDTIIELRLMWAHLGFCRLKTLRIFPRPLFYFLWMRRVMNNLLGYKNSHCSNYSNSEGKMWSVVINVVLKAFWK